MPDNAQHDEGQRAEKRIPYTPFGLTFGAAIGLIIAIIFFPNNLALSISLGLTFGAGLGLTLGAVLDAQRRRE